MVINHLNDHDSCDFRLVDTTCREPGHWIVVWPEQEPCCTSKVEGKLASPVCRQFVQAARSTANVGESGSSSQHTESPPEGFPLLGSKPAHAGTVGRAVSGQLSIGPRNLYLAVPLTR
jgi:hypothetical protein